LHIKLEERIVNKTELIANVAESAGISKAAADRAFLGFLEAVTDSLQNGDNVTLAPTL
jgi:DNA-binding protein HU-beta